MVKNIVVYSTSTCPFCFMVKDFLTENKVKFKDVDVGKDRRAAIEMINKSGQTGVPVTDIDGTIIVGFDRDAIKKALKIK